MPPTQRPTPQARTVIEPQEAQRKFLSTPADIAIFGGGAGGGKSWSILLEPLRHVNNPRFGATIFRRTFAEITQQGGLWEESGQLYPLLGAVPNVSKLYWQFPSGAQIRFAHMQHDSDMFNYQGGQIPLIEFDEVTHFSEEVFFYMLSRNRSMCGVRPYIRATCNPDPESWIARFLEWWIDQDSGLAITERSGVIRWFVRYSGQIHWADTPGELTDRFPGSMPLSVTFIPATLQDNKILMEKDPGYLAKLMALPLVDRERLLGGNWKIKAEAGKVFNREWFEIIDTLPIGPQARDIVECRFWDFAATKKTLQKPDPDYTVGFLMRRVGLLYIIMDVIAVQLGPAEVEKLFAETTKEDAERARKEGITYRVRWEEEPGSAGKRESWRLASLLSGHDARGVPARGDKITRAKPLAAQAEVRNVKMLQDKANRRWNEQALEHFHHFPDWPHDDIVDGGSGAFDELAGPSEVRVYGPEWNLY